MLRRKQTVRPLRTIAALAILPPDDAGDSPYSRLQFATSIDGGERRAGRGPTNGRIASGKDDQRTGVSNGLCAKWAPRLSIISWPIAVRVSTVALP